MGLEQHWASAANTLVALATTYGVRVVGAIIILIAGWWASSLAYRFIVRLCGRSARIDRTVTLFLANGARYTALVITFSAVLSTSGIATTSFVPLLVPLGIPIALPLRGPPS